MKKLVSLLFIAMLCFTANGQIVTSRSVSTLVTPTQKAPSRTTWVFRAGVGSNTFTGKDYEDLEGAFGYNLGFEFNKSIKSQGAYWGMGFLLGSRGYKYSESSGNTKFEDKLIAHNIQWVPFNFGWKIAITDEIKIDPHVGAYLSCDYAGKSTSKLTYKGDSESEETDIYDIGEYNYFDAGMNFGVGIWYKRFNLDLMYQKGFLGLDVEDEGGSSNFMVRLGVAF